MVTQLKLNRDNNEDFFFLIFVKQKLITTNLPPTLYIFVVVAILCVYECVFDVDDTDETNTNHQTHSEEKEKEREEERE